MPAVEEYAWEDTAKLARRRARIASWRRTRRIKRFDIVVASALLLLLILGWAKDLVMSGRWPGSDLFTASHSHHAWSGGTLR
jgi:hypothetical protein